MNNFYSLSLSLSLSLSHTHCLLNLNSHTLPFPSFKQRYTYQHRDDSRSLSYFSLITNTYSLLLFAHLQSRCSCDAVKSREGRICECKIYFLGKGNQLRTHPPTSPDVSHLGRKRQDNSGDVDRYADGEER